MSASVLKKNIVANFTGSIWQALMGLVFVPLYVKFLGVESYGLIGIFATLQATFSLLDMGLSTTLNREMARLSVIPGREQEMRNLVRSMEVVYWGVAVFIGITITIIAPFITHHWIKAVKLSPQTIEQALLIMGFVMALQWPAGFYSGGLMGLQRQVLLNGINVGVSTLRGAGAVLILWLFSPTIQAFFLWQVVVSIINTFLLSFFLWRKLPYTEKKACFQKQLLVGIWRFAAGLSGITVLSTILTQMDKIILSKMLPLEIFGYYTLAGAVAMSLGRLMGPVFTAIYPSFTQLITLGDQEGLKQLYHKAAQTISVLILPITIVVATFSYDFLFIWTQNPNTAKNTYILVSLLICGTALNGLMGIPYMLQLAYGWTKLAFYANLISVTLLVPLVIFMTKHYGAVGGASVWVILNLGYVLISIQFMHRVLLKGEKWHWYRHDIGYPLAASLLMVGFLRLFAGSQWSQFIMALYLGGVLISTIMIAAITTPATRAWFFNNLAYYKHA